MGYYIAGQGALENRQGATTSQAGRVKLGASSWQCTAPYIQFLNLEYFEPQNIKRVLNDFAGVLLITTGSVDFRKNLILSPLPY